MKIIHFYLKKKHDKIVTSYLYSSWKNVPKMLDSHEQSSELTNNDYHSSVGGITGQTLAVSFTLAKVKGFYFITRQQKQEKNRKERKKKNNLHYKEETESLKNV